MEKTLHKQLQHWTTKSQMVQDVGALLFYLSHLGRAQGHVPRGEKIPELGMEKRHCRSAVMPGGQDILQDTLLDSGGCRSKPTHHSNSLKHSCSLGNTISKVGQNLYRPSMIQECPHCLPMAAPTLAGRRQLGGCDGTCTVLYSLGHCHLSRS